MHSKQTGGITAVGGSVHTVLAPPPPPEPPPPCTAAEPPQARMTELTRTTRTAGMDLIMDDFELSLLRLEQVCDGGQAS